ncbi:ATP-dependent DNA helicase yku80 [Malassezia nana]|uniref:ATP-dependent DNA helicase II subunit 2 n=1 Tax=Malassezia nana TaxID=180528 RepID=A0AAF0EJN9_9BASI|nr:ATP-dependent DNA helicase yku80 [Malassezia nana]
MAGGASAAQLAPRTLVTFVVDVSQAMSEPVDASGRTRLAQCQTFVALRLLEMMLRGLATIKASIVVYGGGSGTHELCAPARPTLETLHAVQQLQRATQAAACDPLEALAEALRWLLEKGHGEPSAAWTRVVYFVTRAHSPLDTTRAEALRHTLTQSHTQLRVIGIDLGSESPPFWLPWVASVPNALLATPDEAEAQARAPTVQHALSRPLSTTLSFGEPDSARAAIEIPVQLHKATAQQRPMAPRRMAHGPGTPWERQLEAHRAYYKAAEVLQAHGDTTGLTPLPDDGMADAQRAYHLGASLVPVMEESELDTRPALEILHFVHARTYRREYHMGETYYVLPHPRSPRAQIALSSLVQAAAVKQVYALCRYVARAHAEPKNEFDGFYMVRVPFRDDVRRWAFPPLDRIVTSAGHTVRTHTSIPTPTQQAHMDAFVAQMDLMDMDDDGDPEGWYAPSLSYAPAVHGTKQAILHRFLHPGTPLPPLHPSLTEFLHTPPRAEARARAAREVCAAATGAESRPPAAQAPDVSVSESAPYTTPPMHVPSDSDATPTDDETTSLGVTVAGSALRFTHAAHDFETLVHSTSAVSETCAAMAQLLLRWLDRDPPTDEMIAALRAFRSAACALDESLTWNTYVPLLTMPRFAHTFRTKARSRTPTLWHRLQGRLDLGLITASEDPSRRSHVDLDEARAFVASS